jgi:hypothetical protein
MQLNAAIDIDPATVLRQIADQLGAKPTVAPSAIPLLGELWPGQGGRFVGTIRDEGSDQVRYVIAPEGSAAQFKGPWGEEGTDVAGATSASDGRANTTAMAAAGSEIAKAVLALSIDGFADFHIPSRHELSLCEMNARDLFEREWYWSSTQSSSHYAWLQYFTSGSVYTSTKDLKGRVRAVRTIRL